jgi:hypothetical protein
MGFVDESVKCSIDTHDSAREIEAVTDIPIQWDDLMIRKGFTSIRQLAKAADLNHTIVNRVIMKDATTSAENMQKIAWALDVPVEELYGITSGVAAKPLSIPKGTEKLSERQKSAVQELIRSMVEEKEVTNDEFVYEKNPETAQPGQEKTGSVTPIGGYKWRTPAQQKFEDAGRRVAKIRRDFPQDSPSSDTDSPQVDE